MRDPNEVLAEKLKQYAVIGREINAFRIVIPILNQPEPPKEPAKESE